MAKLLIAIFLLLTANILFPSERENSFKITTRTKLKITYKKRKMAHKKTIIYNKYNRHTYNSPGETNTLPSKTIPGESYSIAELIRMSVTGDIPQMARAAFKYDTEENEEIDIDANIDERNILDLTDGTDILNKQLELESEIEANKKFLLEQKKEKAQEKAAKKAQEKEQQKSEAENKQSSKSAKNETA